jgi:predicted nucleic acid-binding protein
VRLLLDTNVLLRWTDADSQMHAGCTEAVRRLLARGDDPCLCAQVLIEYWCAATRPRDVNGIGMRVEDAAAAARRFLNTLGCLPEPPDMAERWLRLVTECGVSGRQAHDARLAALMLAHGVTHILTLNPSDFARYPGITTVTPAGIMEQSTDS